MYVAFCLIRHPWITYGKSIIMYSTLPVDETGNQSYTN